jgi:hypothetical protein
MRTKLPSWIEYYTQPGVIGDPGLRSELFEGLPEDIAGLCEVVQGLVIHYREGPLYQIEMPEERLEEARTRDVAGMLERIQQLDGRALTYARAPEQRFIGCCRDFSLLLAAILRHQGTPARVRCGFSTYFSPDFCSDHWVCEYWNRRERRWVMVDAQQDELHRSINQLTFDPHDVPRDRFLVAGEVWRGCRASVYDPARFGFDPEASGLWVIRSCLLQDLACLNKVEMTPWDTWGLAEKPYETLTESELALIDRVAGCAGPAEPPLVEIRALFLEPGLHVPSVITSYTMKDEPTTVYLGEAFERSTTSEGDV